MTCLSNDLYVLVCYFDMNEFVTPQLSIGCQVRVTLFFFLHV